MGYSAAEALKAVKQIENAGAYDRGAVKTGVEAYVKCETFAEVD